MGGKRKNEGRKEKEGEVGQGRRGKRRGWEWTRGKWGRRIKWGWRKGELERGEGRREGVGGKKGKAGESGIGGGMGGKEKWQSRTGKGNVRKRRQGRKEEEWFLKRKTVGAVSLKQERM